MTIGVIDGVTEEAGITAKTVDDKTCHLSTFHFVEYFHGANKRCEHAATINIADQQHWGLGITSHVHIDDITSLEIYLSWAACPFEYHHLVLIGQLIVGGFDGFKNVLPLLGIGAEVHVANGLTANNDL